MRKCRNGGVDLNSEKKNSNFFEFLSTPTEVIF